MLLFLMDLSSDQSSSYLQCCSFQTLSQHSTHVHSASQIVQQPALMCMHIQLLFSTMHLNYIYPGLKSCHRISQHLSAWSESPLKNFLTYCELCLPAVSLVSRRQDLSDGVALVFDANVFLYRAEGPIMCIICLQTLSCCDCALWVARALAIIRGAPALIMHSPFNENFTAHQMSCMFPTVEHVLCVFQASCMQQYPKLHDIFQMNVEEKLWQAAKQNVIVWKLKQRWYITRAGCKTKIRQGGWGMHLPYTMNNAPLLPSTTSFWSILRLLFAHCSAAVTAWDYVWFQYLDLEHDWFWKKSSSFNCANTVTTEEHHDLSGLPLACWLPVAGS